MRNPPVTAPIGIFDSGLGGLTVFRAIRSSLPRENLVYLGDTARLPYGPKSKKTILKYSIECALFLQRRGIKMLVVACNTASSLALDRLRRSVNIPVVGVILPAARAAANATNTRAIGVVGTEATVASGAYKRALERFGKFRVRSQACPLFVPLVEEGWWTDTVTRQVARRYLKPLKESKIDVLILGCTHYPLLKSVLAAELGRRVTLIDSAEAVASAVSVELTDRGLLRTRGRGNEQFFVTDGDERFSRLACRFLKGGARRARVVQISA